MSSQQLYLGIVAVCMFMVLGSMAVIALDAGVKRVRRHRRNRYLAAYWRAHNRAGGAQ